MVVRINQGKSIRGALSYNEYKVRKGIAELVLASGFSCEIGVLGFSEKLGRFNKLIERCEKIKTNTLHLSLNFPPEENLSPETMQRIIVDYMNKIGFGNQPFLAYRHDDSNHPHIHIVTTNIVGDNDYISFHNIGNDLSEPARKSLEIEYNLIPAESRRSKSMQLLEGIDLKAMEYGESETKDYIERVVYDVSHKYKYINLDELNLILKQFNVVADSGPEGSFMNEHGGLVYSLLDKDGYKTGIPIKASEIYKKPTLKNLAIKFEHNKVKRLAKLEYTTKAVNWAFDKSNTLEQFVDKLKKRKILPTVSRIAESNLNLIYFVDNINRVVFNSDELKLNLVDLATKFSKIAPKVKTNPTKPNHPILRKKPYTVKDFIIRSIFALSHRGLIPTLFSVNSQYSGPSYEFLNKKKKKRKGPPL